MSGAGLVMIFFLVAIILAGAVLPILGGVTLLKGCRRCAIDHASCGGCGYNVSQTIGRSLHCPECGAEFERVGVLPAGGRQRGRIALAWFMILSPLAVAGLMIAALVAASVVTNQAMGRARASAAAAARAQMQAVQLQALQAELNARSHDQGRTQEEGRGEAVRELDGGVAAPARPEAQAGRSGEAVAPGPAAADDEGLQR